MIDFIGFPFFIRYKGELAGFAIFDKDSINLDVDFNMAQFFILRTHTPESLRSNLTVLVGHFPDFDLATMIPEYHKKNSRDDPYPA